MPLELSGVMSPNSANVNFSKTVGTPGMNVGAGMFASGSGSGGPVSTGGSVFAQMNKDGHGMSLNHTKMIGVGASTTSAAQLNLLNTTNNNLNANAFHSRTNLKNGLKFDKVGGGLDYNHANGHGASVGISHIPQFNHTTADVTGRVNLWKSNDQCTSLDANASASRVIGGPFQRRKNFGAGVGLTHRFNMK